MDVALKNKQYAAMELLLNEYCRARQKFGGFASTHEGWAILMEEVDEMWDEVKANNIIKAKEEAVQVGAMALAFLLEIPDE